MAEAEGIPPTASVASVGLGIRYIGDHAWCMSGTFDATQSTQTCLDFSSGTGYILADFQFNAAICVVNSSCVGSGFTQGFAVKFNGIVVAMVKAEALNEDMPTTATQRLIIPPFTRVVVTVISNTADSSFDSTVNMSGRVYDA